MKKLHKGDVVLNQEMTTQHGKITAEPTFQLVSVFLGTVPHGEDPEPLERLHKLGYRQMTMFEAAIRLDEGGQERECRIVYSCLGAVDSVSAAKRFADKLVLDTFNDAEPGTPSPSIMSIFVGTMTIGPIGVDGTPFNGRGPAFFGWTKSSGVPFENHLQSLQKEAERQAKNDKP